MSKEDTQPRRRRTSSARLTVARYAAVMLIAAIVIIVISYFSSTRPQAKSISPPIGSEAFCIYAPFEEVEEI